MVETEQSIWIRLRLTIKRFAVENIRLATADELVGHEHVLEALRDMMKDLSGDSRVGYEDHTDVDSQQLEEDRMAEEDRLGIKTPSRTGSEKDAWAELCRLEDMKMETSSSDVNPRNTL